MKNFRAQHRNPHKSISKKGAWLGVGVEIPDKISKKTNDTEMKNT